MRKFLLYFQSFHFFFPMNFVMKIYSEPGFVCLCNQVHNLTLGLHPKLGLPVPGVLCLSKVEVNTAAWKHKHKYTDTMTRWGNNPTASDTRWQMGDEA